MNAGIFQQENKLSEHSRGMMQPSCFFDALPEQGLFREGAHWRLSPEPLKLPRGIVRQLQGLGHVLASFQDACHELYLRSAAGEEHPWLARMLDAGKPRWLVEAQRSRPLRRGLPRVIRPDLMLGRGDFAVSELDSVPGGQGVTLFLSRLYARAGFPVIGGADGMLEGFRAAHPKGVLFAVSEESGDYRGETEYLARALGSPSELARAESLPMRPPGERTLYRFFELFDAGNIPHARDWIEACAAGALDMSPAPVQHIEEKIWMALFHLPGLQTTWRKLLRGAHYERLRRVIPFSWVVDPAPLPPQAALPRLGLHSWDEVAALSQKERRLVLKISGFDPAAWGARGVYIGHDMPGDEWKDALQRACADFPNRLWLLQEFRPGDIFEHPWFPEPLSDPGRVEIMKGRVRLCPYYYRQENGQTALAGCLATIAPADKKKIHGMKDAVLVPCTADGHAAQRAGK